MPTGGPKSYPGADQKLVKTLTGFWFPTDPKTVERIGPKTVERIGPKTGERIGPKPGERIGPEADQNQREASRATGGDLGGFWPLRVPEIHVPGNVPWKLIPQSGNQKLNHPKEKMMPGPPGF